MTPMDADGIHEDERSQGTTKHTKTNNNKEKRVKSKAKRTKLLKG